MLMPAIVAATQLLQSAQGMPQAGSLLSTPTRVRYPPPPPSPVTAITSTLGATSLSSLMRTPGIGSARQPFQLRAPMLLMSTPKFQPARFPLSGPIRATTPTFLRGPRFPAPGTVSDPFAEVDLKPFKGQLSGQIGPAHKSFRDLTTAGGQESTEIVEIPLSSLTRDTLDVLRAGYNLPPDPTAGTRDQPPQFKFPAQKAARDERRASKESRESPSRSPASARQPSTPSAKVGTPRTQSQSGMTRTPQITPKSPETALGRMIAAQKPQTLHSFEAVGPGAVYAQIGRAQRHEGSAARGMQPGIPQSPRIPTSAITPAPRHAPETEIAMGEGEESDKFATSREANLTASGRQGHFALGTQGAGKKILGQAAVEKKNTSHRVRKRAQKGGE